MQCTKPSAYNRHAIQRISAFVAFMHTPKQLKTCLQNPNHTKLKISNPQILQFPNEMTPENLLLHHPLSATPKLSLGCPTLDRLLHGGVPCATITELVAESGTGKTQLSLQLLLTAQYPLSHGGLNGSAIYLHSEFPFPCRRLRQLSLSHPFLPNSLENIFVKSLYSAYHLLDLLPQLEKILSRNLAAPLLPVKLVVIDSIAALFRSEFDNNREELAQRSKLFFKISSELKAWAVKYGVAVVVTNQVGDAVGSCGSGLGVGNSECLVSSGRRVSPALGLAWTHCVNIRLFMWRENEIVDCKGEGEGEGESIRFETRRFIRVVFAPHLPDSSCQFIIKREGLFGIDR